jgi:hypothetical protein
VLKVEGQDRQALALGHGHHRGVREPEAEVGEARVDLNRASQQSRREEDDRVLAGGERIQERARGVTADPSAQELIDLDDDGFGNDELAPELRNELGREPVRAVAPVRRREQWPGVGDDLQRALTSSRR